MDFYICFNLDKKKRGYFFEAENEEIATVRYSSEDGACALFHQDSNKEFHLVCQNGKGFQEKLNARDPLKDSDLVKDQEQSIFSTFLALFAE